MKKIRAILIDDERHCRDTLEWELERGCPEVEILAKCASAAEGIKAIAEHAPDVIFLDVEMPRMNGFEMLNQIGDFDFQVIFTTAFQQFALKAFRVHALDYLLKPVEASELKQAVGRLQEHGMTSKQPEIPDQLAQIKALIAQQAMPQRVSLPTLDGLEIVAPAEIIKIESDSNYSTLSFDSGRTLVVSKTLKEVGELLSGHGFIRIHHSCIVNHAAIKKYVRGDGGYVILHDDSHQNVSRSRKQDLLDVLI